MKRSSPGRRTLEERVDQKTRELKRAHEQVLHVEKMATIGKMAAVVAHEINNPLSGILTYAKLMRKWIERGQVTSRKAGGSGAVPGPDRRGKPALRRPGQESADLLAHLADESAKHGCEYRGEPERQAHRASDGDEGRRGAHWTWPTDLPRVQCDPGQIEQVVLALIHECPRRHATRRQPLGQLPGCAEIRRSRDRSSRRRIGNSRTTSCRRSSSRSSPQKKTPKASDSAWR